MIEVRIYGRGTPAPLMASYNKDDLDRADRIFRRGASKSVTRITPCAEPGCPTLTNKTYCGAHQRSTRSPSSTETSRHAYRVVKPLILRRDHHRCHYCGNPATEVDHKTPVSQGGLSTFDNMVAACTTCNAKKADKAA